MEGSEKKMMARWGLWGIFPNLTCFYEFLKNDTDERDPTDRLITWAKEEQLIEQADRAKFEEFIEENKSALTETKPRPGYSFGDLLKDFCKKQNTSVNKLVPKLNKIADKLGFEVTDAATLSRIKQSPPSKNNTPSRRRALRLLSFLICQNLPKSGWSYPLIFHICCSTEEVQEVEEKEGVRIAFHIEAKEGSIIDSTEVKWLAPEIEVCMEDLGLHYLRNNKITSSATTSFLNIPRVKGGSEPRFFAQSIRDALYLAHQVSVRWILSKHSSPNKGIKIAIVAGDFQKKDIEGNLDLQIQALLETKLPNNPTIIVSDFAYLCTRVADIRVIFSDKPLEIDLYGKNVLNVWSVKAFWSFQYFDFVPLLLKDDMVPNDPKSHKEFRKALYLSQGDQFLSLEAINKYPQNTMLILEVAKVLAARRLFHEAYTLISKALTADPYNIVALTYRMFILANLALKSYGTPNAELFFKRAEAEGQYIEKNCIISDEEFYSEYGLLFYTMALTKFNTIRSNKDYQFNEKCKNEIIVYIKKSEELFLKGSMVSPTGAGDNSLYYLLLARSIRYLMENDETNQLFIYKPKKDRLIKDKDDFFGKVGVEIFTFVGWIDDNPEEQAKSPETNVSRQVPEPLTPFQEEMFMGHFFTAVNLYENAVLSRVYSPDVKYAFATVIFDFCPQLTVGLAKKGIKFLKEAIIMTDKVKEGIYSIAAISNRYSQIQEKDGFVKCVERAIEAIEQRIGDDLEKKDDDYIIDREKLDGLRLTLLNIDNIISSNYIYPELED